MRPIYDEDGDGVEDNVKKTRDELDRFYEPAVYREAEDIYNTHHGNLPGHVRKAEYEDAPSNHAGDVKSKWSIQQPVNSSLWARFIMITHSRNYLVFKKYNETTFSFWIPLIKIPLIK